jgi:hypothetical protein
VKIEVRGRGSDCCGWLVIKQYTRLDIKCSSFGDLKKILYLITMAILGKFLVCLGIILKGEHTKTIPT